MVPLNNKPLSIKEIRRQAVQLIYDSSKDESDYLNTSFDFMGDSEVKKKERIVEQPYYQVITFKKPEYRYDILKLNTKFDEDTIVKAYKGDEIHENCIICFDDFEKGEMIRQLHCDHVFHSPCIWKWLERNICCPICSECFDEYV